MGSAIATLTSNPDIRLSLRTTESQAPRSSGPLIDAPAGPTVLVLDGEQRAALAVVRSLGRRGCTVYVGSSARRSLAGGSRYTAGEAELPDPLVGTDKYASAVRGLVEACRATLVLPVAEASTRALLERLELLVGASVPVSSLAHFLRATDKAYVLSLAAQLGIDVPRQWAFPTQFASAEDLPVHAFPVVVKPPRSVAGPEGRRRKEAVSFANSTQQLREILSNSAALDGPLLVQERIEGPGLGVFLLRWEGEILASFAHRRIREKPPSGGVSVCCESVPLPASLYAQAVSLLDALDWSGVAMIEFKHDTRTGRNCLMEINPRFWGSLQLAVDAGVDFPWYLVQLALGKRIAPVHRWRIGIRSRWALGELDHLIARLLHSRGALNLSQDAPGLLRTAASVLIPFRPHQKNDVMRLSDPAPTIREFAAWLQDL